VFAENVFAEMSTETLIFAGLSVEALLSKKSAEMLLAELSLIETSEFAALLADMTVETLLASSFAELSVGALPPEMSVEMFSVEKLFAGSLSHLRQTKLPSSFVKQDR
jgi:hypothetical protein